MGVAPDGAVAGHSTQTSRCAIRVVRTPNRVFLARAVRPQVPSAVMPERGIGRSAATVPEMEKNDFKLLPSLDGVLGTVFGQTVKCSGITVDAL